MPRLTVSLTPDQHSALTRIADLEGRSASSVVREVLSINLPIMAAASRSVEALKARRINDVARIVELDQDGTTDDQDARFIQHGLAAFIRLLGRVDAGGDADELASPGAAGVVHPPTTNRGVNNS